ncbi:hypothetical protein AALA00_00405 [Lachnospiraceae bacterium 46-15]
MIKLTRKKRPRELTDEKPLKEALLEMSHGKLQRKFRNLLEDCMANNTYAAIKATNMLNDECYHYIKNFFISKNEWTSVLDEIEIELKKIALKLVSFFEADADTQSHHKEAAS